MAGPIPVGLASIAHNVPDWIIDNEYFTHFVETSDEWIQQRTGIRQRRWLKPSEKPSDMFVVAGRKAIERAGLLPEEIDLLVVGSVTGDYTAPSMACVMQDRLGLGKCGAFDIAAACSGFLYALGVGSSFVGTGKYRNVLVMGGEAMSRIVDKKDRTTCVLFGDGCGAAVLQPHEVCKQGLIEDFVLGADGSGAHFIRRPRGGGAEPITPEILASRDHYVKMKGREVYRFAYNQMSAMLAWAMEGKDMDKLGWMIPHQMNRRILTNAIESLGIPPEKVLHNIERYGNTSSGSVPILMSEAWERGLFQPDTYIVLAAFGAGLTWAGVRILW